VKSVIDEVMKALKAGRKKSADYNLNLFNTRMLKPDETVAKSMPGLEEDSKSSLLRARLMANVQEKNFMELLSDKSWKELVTIFDKSVDYKSSPSKDRCSQA
jgi:hypothetical protein